VQNRPGLFTGSGIPMRFADLDGTMIDCYQATTQMTDESGQSYPFTPNALLDKALGPEGWYGAFVANLHFDYVPHPSSDAVVASALQRGVPVVSALQMLTWLDGRNGSSFRSLGWSTNELSFQITRAPGSRNLRGMVPRVSTAGTLGLLTRGGAAIPYTIQTIKGVDYAFFSADSGAYVASYAPDTTPPVISSISASPLSNGDETIAWSTNEPASSRVDYGTTPSLGTTVSAAELVTVHSLALTGLAPGSTYYYRVTSADAASNSTTAPATASPPLTFESLPPQCQHDDSDAEFSAGTTTGTYVSHIDDGEVILAPALATEFSGTNLPATLGSFPWVAGGTTTVSGGQLTVDGTRVNAIGAGFGPGRSLEFAATFSPTPFQHAGFGGGNDTAPNEIFNTSPWAMFSTGSSGTQLLARTWDGGTMNDVAISSSLIGTPHRYRIDWNATTVDFYVDGALVSTHTVTLPGTMRPALSDLDAGGGVLTVDWMHLGPYAGTGTYESRVLDGGSPPSWGAMSWTADMPAGTSLDMSVRSGGTPTPDGTWTAYAAVPFSGTVITGASRYLQYKAALTSNGGLATPALLDLVFSCNSGPDVTPPIISNLQITPAPNGTEATVSWSTNELANSRVDYGPTPALGITVTNAVFAPTHSIVLSGLLPGRTYYVRATSADAATNSTTQPAPPAAPLTFVTLPPVCFMDDTDLDFAAGTLNGTSVARVDDGEVILAPALSAGFEGSALPSTFGGFPWSAGGTSTVANGVLTIDGSRVNSLGTGFLSGRSLEFVATFAATPFQHVGFGGGSDNPPDEIFNTSPWAMFSTGGTATGLLARTWDGTTFNDQAVAGSLLGTPHRYRIDWNTNSVDFYVDGGLVSSHTITLPGTMRPAASDFNLGGPVLTVDWMRLSPYTTPGTFESRVFDGTAVVYWENASWTTELPAGTSVSIATRTGDTPVPDGTWTAYIPVAGSGASVGRASRFIQYRAVLTATNPNVTPALRDFGVTCRFGTLAAEGPTAPNRTGLAAARPMPFRDRTTLECSMAHDGPLSLVIYGVDGRRIRSLATGARQAGVHRFQWDGRDDDGRELAAGIYYARMVTADGRFNRTLVRVR
jgi:hypothetical protein